MEVNKARASDKPQKLSDGGGLYLLVQPNGAKYWRLDYRFEGKRKTLALGVYPAISLVVARDRRDEARKLLINEQDPSATHSKKAKKINKLASVRAVENSFFTLANEYHTLKLPTWTAGHGKQWLVNMERYAFPFIGTRPITEITATEIWDILRKMEAQGIFETRDRLYQTINAVMGYAASPLKGLNCKPIDLSLVLKQRPKAKNFACITHEELPAFLNKIAAYHNQAKVSLIAITALRLLMLTATRTSEVRFAQWQDIDLDGGVWTIPEEQQGRKGKQGQRKAHTVPLSRQAVAVLRELHPLTGHRAQVFPNRNDPTKVISENTVLKIIEGIGYKGRMTGHGFRSLARSMLGDMGYRREVLEAMLSHAIENATEAAYVRTTYLKERRDIMQVWADHLDAVQAGVKIILLQRKVA